MVTECSLQSYLIQVDFTSVVHVVSVSEHYLCGVYVTVDARTCPLRIIYKLINHCNSAPISIYSTANGTRDKPAAAAASRRQ